MSSDRLPPLVSPSSPERPLDLTVKRSDMEPSGDNNAYNPTHQYSQSMTTVYSPTSTDYIQSHNEQCGYYDPNQPYQCVYNSDASSTSSANLFQPPTETIPTQTAFYASPPVQDYNQMSYERDPSSSCVLPKKRKNLWRPYDSRAAAGNAVPPQLEKDGDSLSDSGSSSSDQEFKTPATPMDPMKKRKRNMLRYAEEQFDNSKENNMCVGQSSCSSSQSSVVQPPTVYNNTAMPSQTSSLSSYTPSHGPSDETESRDNLISDFKKRDVFGWSLKLQKPPEDVTNRVNLNTESNNVCKDGDKTYIELQTVKKNSQEKSSDSKVLSSSTASKVVSASPSHAKKSMKKNNSPNKNAKPDVLLENENNSAGGRVFIQRRDNVVESVDETQNVPEKGNTKKTICLIDLIEEIEADALKREALEEDTKQKNNNVVKLLEQCNFVKLQALDYLMANVLIQDNGPSFKNKNETVQKMLKGDKIGSVNMLDVIELQVEIGLN